MRKPLPIREALLVVCLCAAAVPAGAQAAQQLSLEEVVSRMQAAQSAARNNPQYVAIREYRLSSADSTDQSSTVLARVEYLPPSKKQFTIQQSQGSDRGERVVRKVLEHEAEMAAHAKASEFTTDNYRFALLGNGTLAGKQFYVLQLSPKRECTELVRGKMWVDSATFLVTRIEGEPAKNPSWWVKSLHLTIDYGRADGMWLPLETRATADLRLIGKHTLSSESVQVQAVTENAKLQPAKPLPRKSKTPHSAAAAGVWVAQ
jgi:outer membrane lipoprotein-sorting protein